MTLNDDEMLHVLHVAPNVLIGRLAVDTYFASAPEIQRRSKTMPEASCIKCLSTPTEVVRRRSPWF
jgi:hypothetical protein